MPIYEFVCMSCGKPSEQLCPIQWEGKARCPHCGSHDLKKLLSAFCSPGNDGGGGCAGCTGKNCKGCK
ncbi:MAG: zinc ribbon domain-containing protein [Negativicutes bacterium]|nr:zinc ribbon domain-containing protein [Negativicutes bacterium]